MTDNAPETVCGVLEWEFKAYKEVQKKGKWNMFSKEAQLATGLSKDKYMLVIKNYRQLAEKWGGLHA